MILDEPLFREPKNFREIPTYWWDLLLDFNLWEVRSKDLPKTELDATEDQSYRFANAFRYQARQRGLRASTRTSWHKDGSIVYVQAIPPAQDSTDFRWPLEQARPAPLPPKVLSRPAVGAPRSLAELPDYSSLIQKLLDERMGPSVAPEGLREHLVLGWVAQDCSCGTEDFRSHQGTCPVYLALPILERQLKRLDRSPEDWFRFHR